MADRIWSIDSMRIIAMIFIVSIHTDPFRGLGVYGNTLNFLIDSTARFAVPFFFVTSGYFFALKAVHRDPTTYFIKRATTITSLYIFGLLLAFPVFLAGTVSRTETDTEALVQSSLLRIGEFISPLELLYYGTSISVILWFLPALLFSLGFIYLAILSKTTKYLLPLSMALHIIGLLGASYTMFVDIPVETRDALFFGFFYTSLGYWIAASDWQPNSAHSSFYLGATILVSILHIGERYVLGYVLTGETLAQGTYTASYTISTAFLTFSLFLFLLSRPNLGRSTSVPSWGKYAVGIYVVHPAVLYVLERTDVPLRQIGIEATNTLLWHFLLTPATFFGALFVYLAAHNVGLIEIGGDHLPRLSRIRDQLL
ncbi:acyltransferase family protein [Halalkalicoccus paucihalophilus]|uniref:Acyltransferase family protein n=1 Tax=Halalkalicoccus paucihalophilus TaxID=1008153 RepID=A0A151A8F9_9EURY|nr:acyltransferase family protein [Halalkalicoccus paucihalophilus]